MKKYTLKTVHEQAIRIVDNYMGLLPDFEIETNARIETLNSETKTCFIMSLTPKNRNIEFSIFEYAYNVDELFIKFEREFKILFEVDLDNDIQL